MHPNKTRLALPILVTGLLVAGVGPDAGADTVPLPSVADARLLNTDADGNHRVGKEDDTIAGEGNLFNIEDRAFLKAVRTGDAGGIKGSYEDAVKTLEISIAANKSAQTGRTANIG